MLTYFRLQFKITNRKFDEFGLPPLLAYAILVTIFFSGSIYLFSNTEYAVYLYMLIVLSFALRLTEKRRIDFLKTCFKVSEFWKIRFLENSLIVSPFVIYLLVEKRYIWALVFLLVVSLFVFFRAKEMTSFVLPTPFGKRPFEFTSGFRNTFFVFPLAYLLAYISVSVDNFNLGIFSMLLVFIVVLSYYSKLENEMYIWSFSYSSKAFLKAKIKTALLFSTLLCLPILIVLCIYFTIGLETLLIFLLLCYAYLVTIILAKYATYPSEINIPQGILIAVSLIFPPLLVGLIPYFYSQSIKRLNTIL